MVTVPGSWELASLVCKLLFYFGAATLVGGSLCLWLYNDGSRQTARSNLLYIAAGAFLGFQGIFLNFLVQVGQVNDRGLAGMFDPDMAGILLDTQLGDATFFRLAGFVIALVSGLFCLQRLGALQRPPRRGFYRLLLTINLFALLLLLMGFRFSGHVAVLSLVARLAVALHFFAFAAWIGSLYPLYRLAAAGEPQQLHGIMKRFGDNAATLLILLLGAGVLMALELFNTLAEVFTTAYGRAFLVKLLLAGMILAIAALNKLRLTPALASGQGREALRRSIAWEMGVAALILGVTAYFSTVVGPAGH